MAKQATIVDIATNGIEVVFFEEGAAVTIEIPRPADGTPLDQHLAAHWPAERISELGKRAAIDAALTAAVGATFVLSEEVIASEQAEASP